MQQLDLSRPAPRAGFPDAIGYIVVDGMIHLEIREDEVLLPRFASEHLHRLSSSVFLGWLGEAPCYACPEIPEGHEAELTPLSLRRWLAASPLTEAQFTLASRAVQLIGWQKNHRFCSRCGAPTQLHEKDSAMQCTACGYLQYPRISPCIIALVTRGEYALLGRSSHFPDGMFSCLAGFIEAGETVEQAVAREIHEEVGIAITDLRYQGSQSWPFPHSLMLGFQAEYDGGDIVIDDDEIVEADWFHYTALPTVPPRGSIARTLIERWVEDFN